MEKIDIDDLWEEFQNTGDVINNDFNKNIDINQSVPKASDIYISTKTKILYLSSDINLYDLFWDLPIIDYDCAKEGIIKKQIKIISNSDIELNNIQEKLSKYKYIDQHIITHLDQKQSETTIYKDVRKLSIGISQKDLLSYRCKKKSAFYNCFVVIIRLFNDKFNTYKEVHAKVFNTGKIEIPGVQNDEIFNKTCKYILDIINNITKKQYSILNDKTETILINSNFNSGYCINRQSLFNILRRKYNLNVSYDPCSYPGIQCKYNIENHVISFMIFRTGSILIVGKCEDEIIFKVYDYLKKLLYDEYNLIHEDYEHVTKCKEKINKPRKKIIYIKN